MPENLKFRFFYTYVSHTYINSSETVIARSERGATGNFGDERGSFFGLLCRFWTHDELAVRLNSAAES